MSYYLNKLDFSDKVNDTDYENLRCVRRILVEEFEDYNISKLIDVLSNVDKLSITLTFGELQDILIKTDTLREKILYLISFKHFVVSNKESDWSLWKGHLLIEVGHMLPKYISC